MAQAAIPPVRRRIFAIVAAIVVSAALVMSGIGYAVWRLNDYLESSVSGPTGSGPCSSADAVDLQLISGDGKIVQACTRDRPACPSQSDMADTRFNMNSQLRSSARRYILLISLDAALPAESPEQTVTLHPGAGFMPESPPLASIASGLVQVTPRDPMQNPVVTVSGSLTVASSQGVARGRMDGSFVYGTAANAGSLQGVTGTFACKR
jgi:hypothetical protein